MKNISLLFSAFLCLTSVFAQIDLRVIGGTYEDVGVCVVSTDYGVVLLGNSSSQDNGFSRGYITCYDQNFDYAWSAITPFNSDFVSESIIDAEIGTSMGTDDLVILTRTLNFTNYNTSFYTFTMGPEEGVFYSHETVLESTSNQNPVALVNWRESMYAIGEEEGDAWMIDIGDESAVYHAEYSRWGHATRTEKINAARVQGDTLYVTGSTEVDGIEQTTVWAWGPDGNPLWAIIQPDQDTYADNYGSDLAVYPGGATLLYNYEREGIPLGHGVIRFNYGDGTPSTAVNTSGEIFVEGVRMIREENLLIKLAYADYHMGTGLDIVLTKLGQFGGYISSTRLGNAFNNIPSDMIITDDGTIYISGTTWGYLNGTSSMCLYRIESEDDIVQTDPDLVPLSLMNDPIFINESSIPGLSVQPTEVYPNPARYAAYLTSHSDWRLYNSMGVLTLTGFGKTIDLSKLPSGTYFVIQDGHSASPLQVIQ